MSVTRPRQRRPAHKPHATLEHAAEQFRRFQVRRPHENDLRAAEALQDAKGVCDVCGQRRRALIAAKRPDAPRGFVVTCMKDFVKNGESSPNLRENDDG